MVSGLISLAFMALSAILTENVHESRHKQVKAGLQQEIDLAYAKRKSAS